uniref:Uncharacterized protein n=1 Tax=Sphaerodactylus townsendi TaxID=933632 RepID=A0ACB8E5A1_9SAUR
MPDGLVNLEVLLHFSILERHFKLLFWVLFYSVLKPLLDPISRLAWIMGCTPGGGIALEEGGSGTVGIALRCDYHRGKWHVSLPSWQWDLPVKARQLRSSANQPLHWFSGGRAVPTSGWI